MRFPPSAITFLVLLAAHAAWCGFAVDAPDSASARANYGIRTLSNPASTTSVEVKDGVLTFSATLASDSTEGYTANVALDVPLCPDRRLQDLRGFKALQFQYRNSEKITQDLSIHFTSDAVAGVCPGCMVYEMSIYTATKLSASTDWRTETFLQSDIIPPPIIDFGPDPYPHYPSLDSVLSLVRSIRFTPRTLYSLSGTQIGSACNKCVGPTMTKQTLEIRNIVIFDKDSNRVALQDCKAASVAPSRPIARFDASYRDGILSVERVSGSSTVDVVSASGHRVTTLAPHESRKHITLERGTWFVVQREPGKAPLTRSLAVVR